MLTRRMEVADGGNGQDGHSTVVPRTGFGLSRAGYVCHSSSRPVSSSSPRASAVNAAGAAGTGWRPTGAPGAQSRLTPSAGSAAGKSERLWAPHVSRRSSAQSSVARAASSDPRRSNAWRGPRTPRGRDGPPPTRPARRAPGARRVPGAGPPPSGRRRSQPVIRSRSARCSGLTDSRRRRDEELVDLVASLVDRRPVAYLRVERRRPARSLPAHDPAEDEALRQRVAAQPVRAVDAARAFADRVEPLHVRRVRAGVDADAAHRVVRSRRDLHRRRRDVEHRQVDELTRTYAAAVRGSPHDRGARRPGALHRARCRDPRRSPCSSRARRGRGSRAPAASGRSAP